MNMDLGNQGTPLRWRCFHESWIHYTKSFFHLNEAVAYDRENMAVSGFYANRNARIIILHVRRNNLP